MAGVGISRAEANRAVRQEALREQLAKQGHIQHVVEIARQIQDLGNELEPDQISRLKTAADIKMKLVSKYLPDLKQTDHNVDFQGSLMATDNAEEYERALQIIEEFKRDLTDDA